MPLTETEMNHIVTLEQAYNDQEVIEAAAKSPQQFSPEQTSHYIDKYGDSIEAAAEAGCPVFKELGAAGMKNLVERTQQLSQEAEKFRGMDIASILSKRNRTQPTLQTSRVAQTVPARREQPPYETPIDLVEIMAVAQSQLEESRQNQQVLRVIHESTPITKSQDVLEVVKTETPSRGEDVAQTVTYTSESKITPAIEAKKDLTPVKPESIEDTVIVLPVAKEASKPVMQDLDESPKPVAVEQKPSVAEPFIQEIAVDSTPKDIITENLHQPEVASEEQVATPAETHPLREAAADTVHNTEEAGVESVAAPDAVESAVHEFIELLTVEDEELAQKPSLEPEVRNELTKILHEFVAEIDLAVPKRVFTADIGKIIALPEIEQLVEKLSDLLDMEIVQTRELIIVWIEKTLPSVDDPAVMLDWLNHHGTYEHKFYNVTFFQDPASKLRHNVKMLMSRLIIRQLLSFAEPTG